MSPDSSMSGRKDYEGYTGRRMSGWPRPNKFNKKVTHRDERRAAKVKIMRGDDV